METFVRSSYEESHYASKVSLWLVISIYRHLSSVGMYFCTNNLQSGIRSPRAAFAHTYTHCRQLHLRSHTVYIRSHTVAAPGRLCGAWPPYKVTDTVDHIPDISVHLKFDSFITDIRDFCCIRVCLYVCVCMCT